jgi:hypothetical protein
MPQYLVANYLPDDFDPSAVTEGMMEQIHALNREMIAAGVRKFACGISPASNAKTLRARPDGKVLVTDGPYTRLRKMPRLDHAMNEPARSYGGWPGLGVVSKSRGCPVQAPLGRGTTRQSQPAVYKDSVEPGNPRTDGCSRIFRRMKIGERTPVPSFFTLVSSPGIISLPAATE